MFFPGVQGHLPTTATRCPVAQVKVFVAVFPLSHRRRINTEEKAKVVAAVWGTDFLYFLFNSLPS